MISPVIQNKLSLSWYLKPSQEFLCGDLGRIKIKHVGLFDLRCRLFAKDDCSVYTGRDYDDGGSSCSPESVTYLGKRGNEKVYDIALPDERFICLSNPEESITVSLEDKKIWNSVRFRVESKTTIEWF